MRDPLNLAGQVIAEKYQVDQLVGEGGFAVVYRAIHTIWNKPVAIKFFSGLSSAPAELRESLQREFIQEGALLTELSSQTAGIVQARDIGTCTTPTGQWIPYMVLEWLDGRPLEDVLIEDRRQGARWSLGETAGFLIRVLPALEVAHARGIAHRDIKPANLFVMGSAARSPHTPIKLLDFGVAKMVSDHAQFKAALAKTGVGISSFTPQYGAPEQFTRSYGATGPWTDVYAMALVAVEMLSGKEALVGDDLVQLGFSSANPERRPTPKERGVALPPSVEAVFQKALSVQPGERFASAGEFLEALLGAIEGMDLGVELSAGPHSSLSRRGSQPSLDDTVLVASEPGTPREPTVVAATLKAPVEEKRGGWFAPLLALVVLAVSVTAVYAASDLDGAKETREALLGVFRDLRGVPPAGAPGSGANSVVATPVVPAAAAASEGSQAPGVCPPGMVFVPAGEFERAAGEGAAPQRVQLAAFCIAEAEVTAAEYASCVDAGHCLRPTNKVSWPRIKNRQFKLYPSLCTFGIDGKGDHPINCVNWEMATKYCAAQQARLPTEAEWQYAASGPDGSRFPWGEADATAQHLNACDEQCRLWGKQNGVSLVAMVATDDGHPSTAPVKSYTEGRSRFGLYDVAGNVAEWISDWHAEDFAPQATNPSGPERGKLRVVRGGGWDSPDPSDIQPSHRAAENPAALHPAIGFRCAKAPAAP